MQKEMRNDTHVESDVLFRLFGCLVWVMMIVFLHIWGP